MKQEKWIKFMPLQREVSEILKQVPRGVRGVFIEQAILEFASKKPSIHFHFDGITKPKRKRRSKEEMARDRDLNIQKSKKSISNDLRIEKSQNLQNREKEASQEQSKGKMMFNFANIK